MRLAGILLLIVVGIVGVGLYAFMSGGLRDAINAHWPPVTIDEQRQKAIDTSMAGLEARKTPNVGVGAEVKLIESILFDEVKDKGVTKLVLVGDRQLLGVTAAIDLVLTPDLVDVDAEIKDWLGKLKPHVVGQVRFSLGVAAALTPKPKQSLLVEVLPVFQSIHIDEISLDGDYDASTAAAWIAEVLNTYADNITGALADNPILNVELPASLQDEFDISQQIAIDPVPGGTLKLTLSAQPISISYRLDAASVLIDADKIAVLAQISRAGSPDVTPPTVAGKSASDLAASFKQRTSDSLDLVPPTGAWIALVKPLLADAFNNAFKQANACLDGAGSVPEQTFATKIPTPDPDSIDCASKMDCSPTGSCNLSEDTRDCRRPRDCPQKRDTRDCSECIVPRLWGGCAVHGNNPACEIAKAAQNKVYEAEHLACLNLGPFIDAACEAAKATQNGLYAADKLRCETEKEARAAACRVEKEGLELACEGMKAAVDALHRTGNVGNFDGGASGSGKLQVCLRDVTFAQDLSHLSMQLETTGAAGLKTHFKFTPLDVAGHILCQLPWTADRDIDVTIPSQSVAVDVSIKKSGDGSSYRGSLTATPISLHFEPSPLALILQNINFHLACPVTSAAINGMTLDLAPFIPELLKDYEYSMEPMDFAVTPDIPEQPLAGRTIKPQISETPKALVVSGIPAQ